MPPPNPSVTTEWDTPSAVSQPPSPLPVLLLPAKFVLGFFYTLGLFSILLLISPFLLFWRLLKYIHDKLFLPRSCDLLWPRPPFNRAFLWLSRQASISSTHTILNNDLPPLEKKCCFIPTPLENFKVHAWDHEASPLKTNDDLIAYVEKELGRTSYVAQVGIVSGFENGAHGRTMMVIETHPDSYPLCMIRIITALSQRNITIEMEPRVYYECALDPDVRFYKMRIGADAILRHIETFCVGAFNLCCLIHCKPQKVWRVLVSERGQAASYRRPSLNGGYDESESSKLTVDSAVQLKPTTETDISFSITEICEVDELQKAERLLRATMAELLTSFLAGALRRYFRESDPCVKHPPDVYAAFAVCSHKLSQCNVDYSCNHLLLPIELPIGVEGMIPRLWSLQSQFAEHNKRCIPEALNTFNSIVRFLLPRDSAEKRANIFFNHTMINISYLKINGDVMLDDNILKRFIPVPPLFLPSRASFTFVQHRDKILLVSTIDKGLFDRHMDIFNNMKIEQDELQKHLAFRLRTLAQTCVLPDRLPSEAPPEAPQNSPSAERAELLPGPSNHRNHRNRRQSVADLNELLREVQEELDEMGRNPNVEDRDGTIKRLHDLEAKIQAFHNGMKNELWGNIVVVKGQEKDDAMKRVAELLAPYKRRVSVSTRKTSLRASKEYDYLRRSSAAAAVVSDRRDEEDRRKSEEDRRKSEENKTEEEVMLINEERREEVKIVVEAAVEREDERDEERMEEERDDEEKEKKEQEREKEEEMKEDKKEEDVKTAEKKDEEGKW
ncbi:hypothetical protein PRIPAC_94847 [Pristionchus pacificus]|uniref:Uncharacterized protein n=1 Tax=Pristionchus pacificus TaxID=54126 RepID=A0A2A6BAL0_PRIPA|nr:hypothetical protein PRIPAC_94847 [Pristionchus pacificus]|eukprot:PDM62925.1 hypothetical protein PRIPAC_50140 [Pristionchus pacificus]